MQPAVLGVVGLALTLCVRRHDSVKSTGWPLDFMMSEETDYFKPKNRKKSKRNEDQGNTEYRHHIYQQIKFVSYGDWKEEAFKTVSGVIT